MTMSRAKAISAIGNIQSDEAMTVLIRELDADRGKDAYFILSALSNFKDKRVTESFLNYRCRTYFQNDLQPVLEKMKSKEMQDDLISYLFHKDLCYRKAAIWFLGIVGDNKAVAALSQIVELKLLLEAEDAIEKINQRSTPPGETRGKTFKSRQTLVAETDINSLITGLKDSDPRRRRDAILSISKKKDINASNYVIPLLNDPDAHVRYEAIGAFVVIANSKALQPLVEVVKNKEENDQIRERAIFVLGLIGGNEPIEFLIKVLQDRNEEVTVREAAASALGRMKDEKAIEPLMVALQDSEVYIRRAAGLALSNLRVKHTQPKQ
jgi:hypothetical protein